VFQQGVTVGAYTLRKLLGSHSLIDADICDGQMLLVSEYAPDGSLATWLNSRGGRLPSQQSAVDMTKGILQGLVRLHGKKIIHRDLKPDNILLQGNTPRLADFGLSRVLKSVPSTNTFGGTLEFVAPETFDDIRSEQADIWATGVILYLLLTGHLPFERASRSALIKAIISDEPAPINISLPDPLLSVIATSLKKDPRERFESATAMLNALSETLGGDWMAQPTLEEGGHSKRGRGQLVDAALDTLRYSQEIHNPTFMDELGVVRSTAKTRDAVCIDLSGVIMEFVRIPAGIFHMGSAKWHDDERPLHEVTISKPFYVGRFPVTQAQYQVVTGGNPSYFQDGDLDRPVEQVSWDDAQRFIVQLNALNNSHAYRLPTEAEWEFAARGGTQDEYAVDLDKTAWYDRNSNAMTHHVGTKSANALGLFDMQGNVWEWCQDWYDEHYYADSPARDPRGPSGGRSRVLRGGSWYCYDNFCRVTNRGKYSPDGRLNSHGFRVVTTC
jgi:formylglycine-generating enzyme required for sulfatase activity